MIESEPKNDKDKINFPEFLNHDQNFFDQEPFNSLLVSLSEPDELKAVRHTIKNIADRIMMTTHNASLNHIGKTSAEVLKDTGYIHKNVREVVNTIRRTYKIPISKKDDFIQKSYSCIIELGKFPMLIDYVHQRFTTDYINNGNIRGGSRTPQPERLTSIRTYFGWLENEKKLDLDAVLTEAFPQDLANASIPEALRQFGKSSVSRN